MAHARRAEHLDLEEGRKYFYGIRTRTNYRKAFPLLWWAASAKRGHPGAMFNLALDYDLARGVRRNRRKAFVLYQRAAKSGDKESTMQSCNRVSRRCWYKAQSPHGVVLDEACRTPRRFKGPIQYRTLLSQR